jgi:formate dehydrogenase subunit gamma
MWIKDNFPNKHDIIWLIKGGGMLAKGVHPPSEKFNAGQKILFWLVIWGGLALSITGIVMLFPFQIELPLLAMEPLPQMQFVTTWHAIIALALVVVVIAHIYIGTIGMEGAYDAMGTGEVDENWAKEHHSVWAKRMSKSRGKVRGGSRSKAGGGKTKAAPAE